MRINLIYAQAANGVIGCNNALPWHLPEDMAHFRALTQGCPVIMGRKTWDSLPQRFRPLPGRRNIVITTQTRWMPDGAEVAHSLPQAISLCAQAAPQPAEVWIIGGASLYAQALPLAQRVEVTVIGKAFAGDAYAPVLDSEWKEATRSAHTSSTGLPFEFVCYIRA